MTFVLVDTNVFSSRFKGDTRGERYRRHLIGRVPAVSFMTTAELYRWSVSRSWGSSRIAAVRAELGSYMTLPLDDETAWE